MTSIEWEIRTAKQRPIVIIWLVAINHYVRLVQQQWSIKTARLWRSQRETWKSFNNSENQPLNEKYLDHFPSSNGEESNRCHHSREIFVSKRETMTTMPKRFECLKTRGRSERLKSCRVANPPNFLLIFRFFLFIRKLIHSYYFNSVIENFSFQ